ncbi:hypothetical protein [Sulfolobus acidocaldarius]|uniref:Uncharacterized protein n=4 Tax=Sulfolobus acidocaldarius TaxID=2285 RepID=Q4JCD9_SULAC|nr:hypothetical protein [Sulfolobus acidocaldarius]AAY79540.1 hypothetical protein Saci_0116 [Sulfolobus acidocaldarius DSM 639]AGE70091.1 hypothetical protein SacN8_00550 [Sulfolobus acidocaldarius N8]ALU29489.1 hypothetical protein ATY89_05695 [Sulfolobus acidocaldarius]ALU32218.1 hypothetical protein ATZ20_08720 [Sulfolobus acidocaldarius]WCM34118.1 hypothetical protein GO597_01580 [Sulfolobus acidocaldarius DSM 639]
MECIKGVIRRILEEEGKESDVDIQITDLPYNQLSVLEGKVVKINSLRYESMSIQSGNESLIMSTFLIIAILKAIYRDDNEVKRVLETYLKDNGIASKMLNML